MEASKVEVEYDFDGGRYGQCQGLATAELS